jgi:hypothetical protein
MLKLVYDLKAGFDDCYLTIKNEEYDLSQMLESEKLGVLEYLEEIETAEGPIDLDKLREDTEGAFYKQYYNNIPELLEVLNENGELDMLREDSVLSISKLYFMHLLGGKKLEYVIPVWEPSNWRLDLDLTTRTSFHYLNALPAREVCDLLKLTKQQIHYYVKTGQIRKEPNPENPKQFKYNRTDVYVLQKKLEKKYDRYKD